MAFNPFHRFRKHQKAFLAILTIVTMFIFVFQFGAGDVFTQALNYFRGFGDKGQRVTTLYGDKVYEADLEQLKRKRKAASDFVLALPVPTANPFGFPGLQGLLFDSVSRVARPPSEGPSPLPPNAAGLSQNILLRLIRPTDQNALQDLYTLRNVLETPDLDKNPEQLRNVQTLAAAAAFGAWRQSMAGKSERDIRDESVFGFSTSRPEELLDFLIWKHQADRMGIVLTDADVGREINRLAGNPTPPPFGDESFTQSAPVRLFMQAAGDRNRRARLDLTARDLLEALRDEFRVQLAQEALLGEGSGLRAYLNLADPVRTSPSVSTPDEFLGYFREQRTTLQVAVLPVDVSHFVSQVKGQPSDEELRHLYELYRNTEPNPADRQPGFKEPRRVRVQFGRIDASSAFYQQKAKEMVKALSVYSDPATSAALRVAAPANALPGGGLGAWAALAGLPHAFDPLSEQYRLLREEEERNVGNELSVGVDLRERRPMRERPEGPAATLGVLLGGPQTGLATPFAAATLMPGLERQYQRATLRAFGSQVLAGASRTPFTAVGLPYPFTHAPLARNETGTLLAQRYEKSLAQDLASENVRFFMEEMRKARGKPADAQKLVERAAKDFGIEDLTQTDRALPRYALADDPKLKKLREAYDKYSAQQRLRARFNNEPPPKPFADWLLETQGVFEPDAFEAFDPTPVTWLAWRTEDYPARLRPFEEVRGEVEAAWRFDKARLLARDEAARLRKMIDEKHATPEDAERLLRDAKLGEVFELKNVARMVPPSSEFREGAPLPSRFHPYEVPADRIPYPPADFMDRLMGLRNPGNAVVVPDRSARHYYVVVLLTRSEPLMQEFNKLYAQGGNNELWAKMMDERRRTLYRDLLKQLRLEAAGKDGVDADGALKIPESVRQRGGETTTSEPE
jgi:hypothetical protein